MNAGMAEVIAAHQALYAIPGGADAPMSCACNRWEGDVLEVHAAHLAQELTKAGYGNVMHAQVTALRAAAADAYGRADLGKGGPSGTSVATFLKARALLLEVTP